MDTHHRHSVTSLAPTKHNLKIRFALLASANAVTVTSLYWNQSLTRLIGADFPTQTSLLSFVPGVTFAGYATGAILIAVTAVANERRAITIQMGLLAGGLGAAGSAPDAIALIGASFLIGYGAAVAQRLLAATAELGGTTEAGAFIGKTLCVALTAVLSVRLGGEPLGHILGWRSIFLILAVLVSILNLFYYHFGSLESSVKFLKITVLKSSYSPLQFTPLLRWTILQQGAMFAAYNAAWLTVMLEVSQETRLPIVICGGGIGVMAALLSGRRADRFGRHDLACMGAAFVCIATGLLLPVAYGSASGLLQVLLLMLGMAFLDAGVQVALVANQSRVQALMPPDRSRLAAVLTVFGSLGGALGASTGYWLWLRFGWQAAISLTVILGLFGFGCSLLAVTCRPSRVATLIRC